MKCLARVRFPTIAVFIRFTVHMYVKHETFRDMRCVGREGGNGAAVGESRIVPRYFSCCQSRTVPMYIAFWQLHSHLYLEKSRVIWDSAYYDTCCGVVLLKNFIIGEILLISYREIYLKGARKGGLEEGVGKGRKFLPSNDTWR